MPLATLQKVLEICTKVILELSANEKKRKYPSCIYPYLHPEECDASQEINCRLEVL